MTDRGNVYIRKLENREIVYTMAVSDRVSERDFEKVMRGLIRKTDTDRFFVDDTEIVFPPTTERQP